jgi:hypothetical protein
MSLYVHLNLLLNHLISFIFYNKYNINIITLIKIENLLNYVIIFMISLYHLLSFVLLLIINYLIIIVD